MAITTEFALFSSEHAHLISQLTNNAFLAVAEGARPVNFTAQFVQAFHSDANPAGPAYASTAWSEGRCVGTVAAFPTRFRFASGQLVIGYQVSSFAVDHTLQRQGIGKKLLSSLTEGLSALPGTFIYTFPNPRSAGAFELLGYRRICPVPTYIQPRFPGRGATLVKGEPTVLSGWNCSLLDDQALRARLANLELPANQTLGLVRDKDYLAWRYLGESQGHRYRFIVARGEAQVGDFVGVLAEHRFFHLRFLILNDIISATPQLHFRALTQAAQAVARHEGIFFNYFNSNFGGARAIPVPDRFNPRPVFLVVHAKPRCVSDEELRRGFYFTGDWMGF